MLSDAWAWRQAHTDGYHDGGRRSGDSRASKNGEMTRTAAAEAMAEERVAQPAAQAAHRP
jgi:hypothetical protein